MGSSGSFVLIIDIIAQKEKTNSILHEEHLHTHTHTHILDLGWFSMTSGVAPVGGRAAGLHLFGLHVDGVSVLLAQRFVFL